HATQLENEMLAIKGALRGLEEGTYGICAACGQRIDIERLRAKPAATLCIVCARRRDDNNSQY
ncbi:MAG: TraR/DksA C4-type zinc finger protein, partial [Kiritimatiellae bacterium]|nr:TraR/DksA C4-type zinc finger protein [Kiritimatiellia bacterium]